MFRILIIEDDPSIRDAIMEAGRTAEVETVAVSGMDIRKGLAGEIALKSEFDAVIVGGYFLEARIQDGVEVVRSIRRMKKRVIIVGTSGDSRREAAFLNAGASGFAVRGSLNNTTAGLLTALDLLKARDEKKRRPKKDPKPTPDQE